jgi:hypothetical protein
MIQTVVGAIVGWVFIFIAVGSGAGALINVIGEKVQELRDNRRQRNRQS